MKQCITCREWVYSDDRNMFGKPHRCPPKWWCYVDYCVDEQEEVYANDAESAAEKFFEEYDADFGYPDSLDIIVRRDGEDDRKMFRVDAESKRTYSASEIEEGE